MLLTREKAIAVLQGHEGSSMPSGRSNFPLVTIRDNAVLARSFVAYMMVEAFTVNRHTFYAVTRCLKIISETVRR